MGIWDDLTGGTSERVSREAAEDTYRKQRGAIDDITRYGDQYLSGFQGLASRFDPYTQAGQSALSRLMLGLGLGGSGDPNEFTNAYRSLPGYQSGLDRGTEAALRARNATGMGASGATLKALTRFGSDYEDQRVGDYLNRLAGQAGMGLDATGRAVGTVGQGYQGQMAARQAAFGGGMQSAGTIGEGMVAGAGARQAGLTNLMGMGANLAGQALGGWMGGRGLGSALGGAIKGGAGGAWPTAGGAVPYTQRLPWM